MDFVFVWFVFYGSQSFADFDLGKQSASCVPAFFVSGRKNFTLLIRLTKWAKKANGG
jgi:hypothetical protein